MINTSSPKLRSDERRLRGATAVGAPCGEDCAAAWRTSSLSGGRGIVPSLPHSPSGSPLGCVCSGSRTGLRPLLHSLLGGRRLLLLVGHLGRRRCGGLLLGRSGVHNRRFGGHVPPLAHPRPLADPAAEVVE